MRITKEDTDESIRKKLEAISNNTKKVHGFPASKFTGKIKSFGDGVNYQKS